MYLHSQSNTWKSALYIRISRADGDKAESDSITNQKKLLTYYVEDNEDLLDYEMYIDENVTGTNFNRPAFQRMVGDIKSGSINCVIVKDLSRFGRDYIGAGKYLEEVFKKYKCRFISILDNLDSYKDPNALSGLRVRIKNICHDNNSQIISLSTRQVKDMMRKQGKHISRPPYGYKKGSSNPYKLVIDEKVSHFIKDIFDMYIKGYGTVKIAQTLNSRNISSKHDYYYTKEPYNHSLDRKRWTPKAVLQVLRLKVYAGDLDQKRCTTADYKNRRKIWLDESQHIIVKNTHAAIIDRDTFNTVQQLLSSKKTKRNGKNDTVHLLSGIMRCADCNSPMLINSTFKRGKTYSYYKCRGYLEKGKGFCDHNHSIKEELLIDLITKLIRKHVQALVDIKKVVSEINKCKSQKHKEIEIKYNKILKAKEKNISKLKELKFRCYTKWELGELSKEDYLYASKRYEDEIQTILKECDIVRKEQAVNKRISNTEIQWLNNLIEGGKKNVLDRKLVISLVDEVRVSTDKQIEIKFKFADEYASLLKYIEYHGNDFKI